LDNSTDGASIQPIMPSGAPALTAVSNKIFAAEIVHSLALGCGLIIKPLRVFNAINILKIVVDVGLVVGMMAAITPIGSAIFVHPNVASRSMMPHVLIFL
jgi:hypothetical protein